METLKILLTQIEIEDAVFELEERIGELEGFLEECPKDKVAKKMVKRRKDKLKELNKQELLIEVGGKKLDLNDQTFYDTNTGLHIFLTARFKTGHFLGFWSHSPWGTCQDQEKGWVVINPETLEITDMHETRSMGMSMGGFSKWRKGITEKFGKSTKLLDGFGNQMWKSSDC